jgi:hypothetical protein
MIDWIQIAQGIAAILATMVAWWNLGLPRLVFSTGPARRLLSPGTDFLGFAHKGDEYALEELKTNVKMQRQLVDELKKEPRRSS